MEPPTPPRSQRSSGRWARFSSCSRATASRRFAGFVLLGLGTAGLARFLVGDDDLELLLDRARGIALVGRRSPRDRPGRDSASCAIPRSCRSRCSRSRPSGSRSSSATRRRSCSCRSTSCSRRRCSRWRIATLRGERPAAAAASCSRSRSRRSSRFSATSYLWTWDERAGAIALAFFVFPFTAGLAVVARAPLASWLPRALVVTLVALGSLFAAIGIWQAQTRTLFFARDVEVANAYTTFFRVTSLFKDPEPVRALPDRADRGAPRRRPAASWPGDRLGRGDDRRCVPLLGPLLLVLAVELRRALRRHVRGRARRLGSTAPNPPRRLCARRHPGRSRGRSGCRERALRERRDERPLATRERDPRRVSRPARSRASGSVASRARARRNRARAHRAGTPRTRRRSRCSRSSACSASRSISGYSPLPPGRSGSSRRRIGSSAWGSRRCSSSSSSTRSSTRDSSRIRSRGEFSGLVLAGIATPRDAPPLLAH